MGIELYWASVKHQYKKRVGSYRVNDEIYSNMDLVKELLTASAEQMAIDAASRGWKKVNNGMPLSKTIKQEVTMDQIDPAFTNPFNQDHAEPLN